jgi:potassium inwardly-rectifying channel subfamily J
LYNIKRDDIAQQRFELVVILEGIIESTGMTTQARTSYLPSEILWGYRFERLITFQRDDGLYRIDYSRFNLTYPVDMITCSAKELKQLHELEKWQEKNHDNEINQEPIFIQSDKPPPTTASVIWHEKKESTL